MHANTSVAERLESVPGSERDRVARCLIIQSSPADSSELQQLLTGDGGVEVAVTADLEAAVSVLTPSAPDLIVLDLHLVGAGGSEIIRTVRAHTPAGAYLPIVVTSGDIAPHARRIALASGAVEFLQKPFDPEDFQQRIRTLLATRFLCCELREQNARMEQSMRSRADHLQEVEDELIDRLALAAEYRDDETGHHAARVGALAARIAAGIGLPAERVELIRRAAALHDIGKLAIPDTILRKPSPLNPEEWEVVKTHTTVGARILARGRSALMQMAEEIALNHHECWDGSGYPRALSGSEIPHVAQIVSVADFFDTFTHDRPYRPAWSRAEALAEIRRQSGGKFDPVVVEAFFQVVTEVDEVPAPDAAR